MKLTIILMTAALLNVSARSLSQQISFSGKNVSLETVFAAVKKQTGYVFFYSEAVLQSSKPVSIVATNLPLEKFLAEVFKEQPLEFVISGKNVFINPRTGKQSQPDVSVTVLITPIRGRVIDSSGKPLAGATVVVKNSKKSVVTDRNGAFVVDAKEGDVVVVTYVGYSRKEIRIEKDGLEKGELRIVLDSVISEIQGVEVVSTGYQEIPKERATGSFVQLDNKILNRTVSTNILDRLVNVTSSLKREKTATSDISIRGYSTINASMRPLIVVDGFAYEEGSQEGAIMLNNLNPNDIESITILRDAASASIWGARSGNGVIVIKTKKGSFNKRLNVQANANVNVIQKPNLGYLKTMSSRDVVEFEKMRFSTGAFNAYDDVYPSIDYFPAVSPVIETLLAQRSEKITSEQANKILEDYSNHDIREDLNKYLLQSAINQQYSVNVNGGTTKNAYYISLGYDKNRANEKGNNSDRFTLRFDNTFKPLEKLEINTYINYTQSNIKSPELSYTSFLPSGLRRAPAYMKLADDAGNPIHVFTPNTLREAYIDSVSLPGLLDWHYRPLDELRHAQISSKQYSTRIGGSVRYTLLSWLGIEVKGQYEKRLDNGTIENDIQSFTTRDLINKLMYINPFGQTIYPVSMGSILTLNNQTQSNWNIRNQLNVNKNWQRHRINALIGYEASESNQLYHQSRKYGFDPLTLNAITNIDYNTNFPARPSGNFGSMTIPNGDNAGGYLNRFQSYFGNAGYTLDGKYTLTLSGRVDKSNFLGAKQNQRIVPLASGGLGWLVSEENFFKINWVQFLKLRTTYGYNGNLNNKATALPTAFINAPNNTYHNEPYAVLATPPNPGLTWEKIGMFNIGIDYRLLNNRIEGSLEYYSKKGINLIGPVLSEPTTGFSTYTGNYANMRGSGVDLILNTANIRSAFSWNTTLLFSYNTDKITSYQMPESMTGSNYVTGESLPIQGKPVYKLYSYPSAGLDPANGNPRGYVSGEIADYRTVYNNSQLEDVVYHGTGTPKFFGSFLNTFSYKSISLSFNITYKLGYYFRKPSIRYANVFQNMSGHSDYALRWQKPGDEQFTNVPSLPTRSDITRDNFYVNTSDHIRRGDHIRLQDIRLSYDINRSVFPRLPFSGLSVYLYANNLGLIWKANKEGLDPEAVSSGAMPDPRSIASGLSLSF